MPQKTIEIIEKFKIERNFALKEIIVNEQLAYQIEPVELAGFITFLKTNIDLRFTILTDLFAADFPARDKRFEIIYNLLSLELNERLIIKTYAAEDTEIYSIANIFSAACWYEREVFDMFGINFINSPDMRRILTDYGFVGHPLKKDFPLTGYVQVKYDEALEQVVYEPVKLDQEYRNFDFSSPWCGPGLLPGDEKADIKGKDKS